MCLCSTVLKFTLYTRLALNSQRFSCVYLPSVGIKEECPCAWLSTSFLGSFVLMKGSTTHTTQSGHLSRNFSSASPRIAPH